MTPYELAQKIGFVLSQKKLKLATVESCTGGSLAKLITDVPGASEWFDCGFITYSNADIVLSTTGIAGPNGGSLDKPVGTVCFGFATKESYFSTDKQLFNGDRSTVREKSVIYSLECLCHYLETGHF